MQEISRWLKQSGLRVIWNQKNEDYQTFHVKGSSRRKPDLFIQHHDNPLWFNCVLEVKRDDLGMREVLAGSKIIEYYTNYITGATQYYDEKNKELTPKYFALITPSSINGKLFRSDTNIEPINPDGWRKEAIKINQIPQQEFSKTYTFIRTLYQRWTQRKPDIRLGILLSTTLDGGMPIPAFQGQRHRNGRWLQCWLPLGDNTQ